MYFQPVLLLKLISLVGCGTWLKRREYLSFQDLSPPGCFTGMLFLTKLPNWVPMPIVDIKHKVNGHSHVPQFRGPFPNLTYQNPTSRLSLLLYKRMSFAFRLASTWSLGGVQIFGHPQSVDLLIYRHSGTLLPMTGSWQAKAWTLNIGHWV